MRTNSTLATAILISLSASAIQLRAATIFNDFGPGNSFSDSGRLLQGPSVGTIADVDQAAAFTLGPTGYESISVRLGIYADAPPNTGTGPLDVIIASDAGGVPGTALATAHLTVSSTGKQIVQAAFAGLVLDANVTYWLVADSQGTFDGAWDFNDQSVTGLTAGRSNGGAWNARPNDDQLAFSVEGRQAVVPEPSTLVGTGVMAIAGLISVRWRRGA